MEQEGQLTPLYWQVNEEQIQTYEILRRESGRSQTILLGSKSSLGDGAHSYEFVDEFPPTDAQELSYQIRAIDFNGAISYSPVVLISAQAEPVRLYPSLISGEDHTLHIRGGVARTLSLFTTEGRMVWSGSINSDSWNVPMELAQGLYLLKVSLTDGSTVTGKLMIAE